MEEYGTYISLGVALGVGLLIGAEREQSAPERAKTGDTFLGGARTHPLFAIFGAVVMLLTKQVGVTILLAGLAAAIVFLVVSYADDVRRGADRGITSEIAFLLSFSLGALALTETVFASLREKVFVVAALAVLTTLLLSIKPALHAFIQRVSREDVFATVKFLVVGVIVLPALPDRAMGPLDALNPRNIGFMVVLIAAISFVGYVAIRLLGPQRGLGLTGLVGGLASSTAVTLSFSGRAREEPRLAASCALAVVLASSIMFGRVLFEVFVVNHALLPALVWPIGAMLVAGLVVSLFLWRRSRAVKATADVRFSNPFELSSAVKFAALFALVLLLSKAATTYFGRGATYLTGVLAGTTDVDAITLSMARLAGSGGVSAEVATTTILLGAVSNTLVKAGMTMFVGGWAFGRIVAAAFAVIIAAGAAGLMVIWR